MLVEHRVHDVDEGLVTVEEAVAAGQEIALEPAFAQVLAEHFHHAPVGRQILICLQILRFPGLPGHFE